MKKTMLKKVGEKMANASIQPLCFPLWIHQPQPPAKLQAKMKEINK